MPKKTVIIGASENPSRYSYLAANMLTSKGHEVVLIGLRKGFINGIEIQTGHPEIENVNTVTMYIRPELQGPLYNYILSLKPSRIIFNPGTENSEFSKLAVEKGIEVDNACTLVLLSIGKY